MSAAAERTPVSHDSALVELLLALRDLAGVTAELDLEGADGDPVATGAVAGALRQLVERTLALLADLQLTDEHDAPELEVPIPYLDGVDPDAWTSARSPTRAVRVGDVCFAGTLELRRVLRELTTAETADEQFVAGETARRKLRRAIRAVLEAARETGMHDVLGGEHQGQHQVADLASALSVRRLYARFRRSLRRAETATPEAVLAAVRYAGGALATLVADPDYADVRASDRAVLRGLRGRALEWARNDRRVSSGLQLLEDVATCGDLLRGINRRQELRAHDNTIIVELAAGPGGGAAEVGAWLVRLDMLYGLDDTLDAAIEHARTAVRDHQPVEVWVGAARARLGTMR